MAINLTTQYPGKIDTTDPAYPYGKAQNITTPSDGTGTPWEKAIVNDHIGAQQALLKSSGIVPSGAADKVGASQYLQSIVEIAGGRAMAGTVGGTGNAITITVATNQEPPKSYFVGMRLVFKPIATNSGATTIDLFGLGPKAITLRNGVAFQGRELLNGRAIEIYYDGVKFVTLSEIVQTITIPTGSIAPGGGGGVLTLTGGFVSNNQEITASVYGDSTVGQSALMCSLIVRTNAGPMIGYDPAGVGLPTLTTPPISPGSYGYIYKNGAAVTQVLRMSFSFRIKQ